MRLIDLDKAVSIRDEDNNAVIFTNIKNAEVKAIPIEWIKEHYGWLTMAGEIIKDWEAECGTDK